VVRHRTLDPAFEGSNPSSPATRPLRSDEQKRGAEQGASGWGPRSFYRGAMRPSRSTGGAGAAHSPLGAMNRAGLAFARTHFFLVGARPPLQRRSRSNMNGVRSTRALSPQISAATASPSAAECLNPCPEHAEATITERCSG
jgi:hypothetical protein